LVDFSTHAQSFFSNGSLDLAKFTTYYGYQLVKRLELLLPLSLLISVIRVLATLNTHRELVALQASGIPMRKIMRPFFLLALFCSLIGYSNEEVFLPKSAAALSNTKYSYTQNPLKKLKKKQFTLLALADSSKLVYQSFDPNTNRFFDVYWIRSFDDIWHMKYLSADPAKPVGEYMDHIVRNKEGFLEKAESIDKGLVSSLFWSTKELHKKQSAVRYQKLSELFSLMWNNTNHSLHFRGEMATYLFRKLAMPLLPFLVLIGVFPFCVTYSRSTPFFLIYGLSLFCFIVFFTLLNAMVIIGSNHVLPPYVAIFLPFLFLFSVTYKRFHALL
jgi:lipopolysaccharide export system permease protein